MSFLHSSPIRKRISLLIICSLLICLPACNKIKKTGSQDQAFETYTKLLFQQEVSSSSISLHYTLQHPEEYGITNAPVTLGTFPTDTKAVMASAENQIAALHTFEPKRLNEENQLTYEVLESYLKASKDTSTYLLYEEPLNSTTGIQAQLPVLLSEYQFTDSSDIDTYLELLGKVPEYFDSLIQFETAKSKAGLFMSSASADGVIAQCTSLLQMGDSNHLYPTFEERIGQSSWLSDTEKESYISANRQQVTAYILPAYETLANALQTLRDTGKNDKGLYYLPCGQRFYEALVCRDTGSSRSVAQLQKLTKQQILDDLTAMQTVLTTSAKVSQDTGSLLPTDPTAILNELEQKIASGFPQGPEISREVKYVPTALEEYLSPAFYLIPAIDAVTENVIYLNNGHSMNGVNLYTTLAHEGYPGHLYQTTYYASKNPDPIRSMLSFGGYTEGWATYAEMASFYYSSLSKQQATLLQKNQSVILGLYALADMGIHHDGWTLEETLAFFTNYGISDSNSVAKIYQLILDDPGNYLKYYIGYLEFLTLKQEIAADTGDKFSQTEFHKAVLDVGPAPFDIVRERAFDAFGLEAKE